MSPINERESVPELDPVILDIVGNSYGMVDIQGEYLFFRLHQSGRVEYERQALFERKRVRREYKISPEEIKEVMQLVERPEFLELPEHYPSLSLVTECPAFTDIAIEYKSQTHNKRITISDYHMGEYGYPSALKELMGKVFQVQVRNRQFG